MQSVNNYKIYCIVVTYNGAVWIKECFSSLLKNKTDLTIIAVDNSSQDDTVELIKTYFPAVRIIETGTNLGFGKANNIGLEVALNENADFVFLINQDTKVEENCLEELTQNFYKINDTGILSPLHLNWKGDKFDTSFIHYLNSCPNSFFEDSYLSCAKDVYEVNSINAAAWLLNRSTIEIVGGFDPLFPHYGEDDDFVERVHKANLKIAFCPKAVIYHDAKILEKDFFKKNEYRLKIFHLLQLKKITNTYRSNWLKFLKSEFDLLTTMLIFRQFSDFSFRFKVFIKMFKYYFKIKNSRRASLKKMAFLNDSK